jgi:hypothetical protein
LVTARNPFRWSRQRPLRPSRGLRADRLQARLRKLT